MNVIIEVKEYMMSVNDIIQLTARKNGVSEEQVRRDMQESICEAINNCAGDPEAQAIWAGIPCKGVIPSPEEFILYISDLVNKEAATRIRAIKKAKQL